MHLEKYVILLWSLLITAIIVCYFFFSGTEKQLKKQSTLEEVVTTRESRQKNVRPAGSHGPGSDKGTGSARSSSNRKQRESSSAHRVTPPPSNPVESVNILVQSGEIIGDPSEFHVVTKKQRKKKNGRSSSIGRNERSHHSMQSNNYHVCTYLDF